MTAIEQVLVLLAGFGAGTINTIVGSGTLITFPTLVLLGVPPLVANVSNTVGLVPGATSGAIGYRRELRGQGRRAVVLSVASGIGGLVGGVLLLALPSAAFDAIVPVLIVGAVVVMLLQPRIAAAVARRRSTNGPGSVATAGQGDSAGTPDGVARRRVEDIPGTPAGNPGHDSGAATDPADDTTETTWPVRLGVTATGVYGGYFGAAQGVILMALLGSGVPDHLQRTNALKNVVAVFPNVVSAVLFIAAADVDWTVAALVAGGSVIGGQFGARVARRMSPRVLRAVVVVIGLVAVVQLVRT